MDLETAATEEGESAARKRKTLHDMENITASEQEPSVIRASLGPAPSLRTALHERMDVSRKRARKDDFDSSTSRLANSSTTRSNSQSLLSYMPLEIWQHVFSFLDPLSLAKLMLVNAEVKAILDPPDDSSFRLEYGTLYEHGQGILPSKWTKGRLEPRKSDYVWARARRRWLEGFPRPMTGLSELRMLQLALGARCQSCQPVNTMTTEALPPKSTIVWPFGVRLCQLCLSHYVLKDDNTLHAQYSDVLPGLPFAFFTPKMEYVPGKSLDKLVQAAHPDLVKCFYRPQLNRMLEKLQTAQVLAPAAAEEWKKGLSNAGHRKILDAVRFDRWELNGGRKALRSALCLAHASSTWPHLQRFPSATPGRQESKSGLPTPRNTSPTRSTFAVSELGPLPNLPMQMIEPAPGQESIGDSQLLSKSPFSMAQLAHPRIERNGDYANRMKAERKAEIERRCQGLTPPILPSYLVHLKAFKAAILIPMALNQNAWQLLKVRLLAERAQLEAASREPQDESGPLTVPVQEVAKNADRQLSEMDRRRDLSLHPALAELSAIVEIMIAEDWRGGVDVIYANAPQFAADVLLNGRAKYLQARNARAEESLNLLPASPGSISTAEQHAELKLEDMKWIYDFKIKPISETIRKEIFTCSACDSKYYAFEPVVQHYAAKHTGSLSCGNAIVYWKADWPAEPIFDPQPGRNRPEQTAAQHRNILWPTRAAHEEQMSQRHVPFHQENGSVPALGQSLRTPASRYQTAHEDDWRTSPRQHHQQVNGMSGNHLTSSPYQMHLWSTAQAASVSSAFLVAGNVPDHIAMTSHAVEGALQESHDSLERPRRRWSGKHALDDQIDTLEDYNCLEEVAQIVRDIWEIFHDVPTSVRLQTVIHRLNQMYSEMHGCEPGLPMFRDAMDRHALLQPLRDISTLTCKACKTMADSAKFEPRAWPSFETLFHTNGLIRHFEADHTGKTSAVSTSGWKVQERTWDWKFDMIEVPPPDHTRSLLTSNVPLARFEWLANSLPTYLVGKGPQLVTQPSTLSKYGQRHQNLEAAFQTVQRGLPYGTWQTDSELERNYERTRESHLARPQQPFSASFKEPSSHELHRFGPSHDAFVQDANPVQTTTVTCPASTGSPNAGGDNDASTNEVDRFLRNFDAIEENSIAFPEQSGHRRLTSVAPVDDPDRASTQQTERYGFQNRAQFTKPSTNTREMNVPGTMPSASWEPPIPYSLPGDYYSVSQHHVNSDEHLGWTGGSSRLDRETLLPDALHDRTDEYRRRSGGSMPTGPRYGSSDHSHQSAHHALPTTSPAQFPGYQQEGAHPSPSRSRYIRRASPREPIHAAERGYVFHEDIPLEFVQVVPRPHHDSFVPLEAYYADDRAHMRSSQGTYSRRVLDQYDDGRLRWG